MFSPSIQSQERDRKVDIGLAALLAMGIILLMLIEMIPKSRVATFPWLGTCIPQGCRSWVNYTVTSVDIEKCFDSGEFFDHGLEKMEYREKLNVEFSQYE